jgi:hypothetical protein
MNAMFAYSPLLIAIDDVGAGQLRLNVGGEPQPAAEVEHHNVVAWDW